MVCWSDASWANRPDGTSAGGYLIGLCDRKILDGAKTHVTMVSWNSNKLRRVARSSLAAEVQAMSNAEDELHLVRGAWAEFNGSDFQLEDPDETIKQVPGTIIIDAKSIYDTLVSQNQPLQLQEKRTALELLAYLKNTELNNTSTRWVHGEANLADALTKINASGMLREFMLTSEWLIVQDDKQRSAKKRKAQGIEKLAPDTGDPGPAPQFVDYAYQRLHECWPEWFINSDSEDL